MNIPNLNSRIQNLNGAIDEKKFSQIKASWNAYLGEDIVSPIMAPAIMLEGESGLLGEIAHMTGKALRSNSLCSQIEEVKHDVPATINSFMHTLRVMSNALRHSKKGEVLRKDKAESSLQLMLLILEWFYCDWQFGRKLSSIYRDPNIVKLDSAKEALTKVDLLVESPAALIQSREGRLALRKMVYALFDVECQEVLGVAIPISGRCFITSEELADKARSLLSKGSILELVGPERADKREVAYAEPQSSPKGFQLPGLGFIYVDHENAQHHTVVPILAENPTTADTLSSLFSADPTPHSLLTLLPADGQFSVRQGPGFTVSLSNSRASIDRLGLFPLAGMPIVDEMGKLVALTSCVEKDLIHATDVLEGLIR